MLRKSNLEFELEVELKLNAKTWEMGTLDISPRLSSNIFHNNFFLK